MRRIKPFWSSKSKGVRVRGHQYTKKQMRAAGMKERMRKRRKNRAHERQLVVKEGNVKVRTMIKESRTSEPISLAKPPSTMSEREDRYGRTLYTKTCDECKNTYEDSSKVNALCETCLSSLIDDMSLKEEQRIAAIKTPEGYEALKKYMTPTSDYEMTFYKKEKKKPRTIREAIKLRSTR